MVSRGNFWFCLIGLLGSVTIAMPAHASGWTEDAGKGRIIITGIFSHSGKTYDNDGKPVSGPDYDKSEIYVQAEYGLTDDLTLILTPSFRRVVIEGPGEDSSGLGYTEMGARYKVAGGGNFVVSAQATARIPGQKSRDVAAQIGSTDPEYDFRGQVGKSFTLGGLQGFAIGEAGYRFRAGDPPNEFHGDFTVGIKPVAKWTIMASSYNTWSDGSGQGFFRTHRYNNIYSGLVYEANEKVSLQFGGLATISGESALRERGAYLGMWLHF